MTGTTKDLSEYNGKPAETQALCARADAWVSKNIVEIDEEWLADTPSLDDMPPTYRQAKLLQEMFSSSDDAENLQWMQQLHLDTQAGMIFCGPDGCGKTETAYSLMKELKKLACDQYIELNGAQLNVVSKKLAKEYVRAIFRYAEQQFGEDGYLIVLFSQIQKCRIGRWVMDFIAAQDSEVIYPIFLERDPEQFSHVLLRAYPMFIFPMPTYEDRLEFFQYHMTGELQPELWENEEDDDDDDDELTEEEITLLKQNDPEYTDVSYSDSLEDTKYQIELVDLSYEQLAEQTEGFTYQQLKQLTDMMRFHLIQMLTESDAVDITDAAKALTQGGRYQIKEYTVRKMISAFNWQSVRAVQTMPYSYAVPSIAPQMQGKPQQSFSRAVSSINMSEAPAKIREAANGGRKDYQYLANYFTGSVEERFARGRFGEVRQEYVTMKDTKSDLEEE